MIPATTQPEKPRYRVKAGSQIVEQNSSATSSRPTDTAGTDRHPFVPASIPERKPLRPHCQHPHDLDKCAGSGRDHCHACRKLMVAA